MPLPTSPPGPRPANPAVPPDPAQLATWIAAGDRKRRRMRQVRVMALVAAVLCGGLLLAARLDGLAARDTARSLLVARAVGPHPDVEPRLIGPADAERAVLFVHGLGGSPGDFADWPERIAAATGARVQVLELPGHGAGPDAFAGADEHAWRSAVGAAWDELQSRHGTLIPIGFSVGAALVLECAADDPPERVALLAPYLGDSADGPLPGFVAFTTRVLRPLVPWVDGGPRARGISDPALPQPPRQRAWPLRTIRAGQRVAAHASAPARLARVDCPVLIVHPRRDRIASHAAASRAAGHLERATFKTLERGDHLIAFDVAREEAFAALLAFVTSAAPGAGANVARPVRDPAAPR